MTNGITTRLTIGIDLGDRRSEVCVLGADGEVKRRFGVATTREGLETTVFYRQALWDRYQAAGGRAASPWPAANFPAPPAPPSDS